MTTSTDTTQRALLNAIIAKPDDDALRLIYSDWLDENGEAERASLVRCQIKHPRWFGDDTWMESPSTNTDGYLDALEWLKSSHCKDEFASTQVGNWVWNKMRPDGIVGVYRRGFIDEIRCTLQQCLDHGKDIVREHPVTVVVATDREPFADTDGAWWINESHIHAHEADSNRIPDEIFAMIDRAGCVHKINNYRDYKTIAEANDALSRALLAWAKS